MTGSIDVRVSDQEREQTASLLRDHFAAGRITQDELNERVQAAYSARTRHDLADLLGDLPVLPATPQQVKAELSERRTHLRRRLLQESGGGLGLFVVCTVIWAANGAQSSFWPVWVLVFVAIPLIRNGWRLYGPSPQLDRVERELNRRSGQGRHRRRSR